MCGILTQSTKQKRDLTNFVSRHEMSVELTATQKWYSSLQTAQRICFASAMSSWQLMQLMTRLIGGIAITVTRNTVRRG
jgi:hypothetical protein